MIKLVKTLAKGLLPQTAQLSLRVWASMRRGSEDPEALLLPILAGTGSFLDVGANMGRWTGPASRLFRQVHAFEPNPQLARALSRVGPSNLSVHAIALSNRVGVARFSVPLLKGQAIDTRGSLESTENAGLPESFYDVPVTTLDALEVKGVDAIKIDVEGHEADMLEGAALTIERERPAMIIEIEERHHPGRSEQIVASIVARGYSAFFLRGGRIQALQRGQILELQPLDSLPMPGQPIVGTYVNNFIFVPLEDQRRRDALMSYEAASG